MNLITCGEFDEVGIKEQERGKVLLPLISFPKNYYPNKEWNVRQAYEILRYHPEQKRTVLIPLNSLEYGARHKAYDLGDREYFSHLSPDGENANRLARRYENNLPTYYPENGNSIESLLGGTDDPEKMINFLLLSPGHRKHLLGENEFFRRQSYIGIGFEFVSGSPYSFYWCIWITELIL